MQSTTPTGAHADNATPQRQAALNAALAAAGVTRAGASDAGGVGGGERGGAGVWPTPISEIAPSRFASRIRTGSAEGCQIALLGLPDELGVRLNSGRPGAAQGPRAFRAALARHGVAEPAGVQYPLVFDAGDVRPSPGDGPEALAATHRRISDASAALVRAGLFPVAVGGGHDLTYGFVRGVIEATLNARFPDAARDPSLGPSEFAGVYFDAHLDVRDTPGSGMPFRRLIENCGVGPLLIVGQGTLVNSREHAEWFAANGGLVADDDLADRADSPDELVQPMDGFAHLFSSFDLDAIDMSAAPGVSAMNPAGLSPKQAQRLVFLVAQHPRLRCFDLMELSPPNDEPGSASANQGETSGGVGSGGGAALGRTARLAAHLFLTFLQGWKMGRLLLA